MKNKLKELNYIIKRIGHRKSSGKDGILIVLPSGIGDAILAVDFIERIVSNNEGITFVSGRGAVNYLVNIVGFSENLFSKCYLNSSNESVFPLLDYYKDYEFDTIVTSWGLIACCLKSRRTICINSKEEYNSRSLIWRLLRNLTYTDIIEIPQSKWVPYRFQKMNELLGGSHYKVKTPALKTRTQELMGHSIIETGNYAVICVDSSNPKRRWPNENFISLIKQIHNQLGISIVLTGTIKNECLMDAFDGVEYVVDICQKTTFEELVWVIANSEFLVGVDSGNIHLAASLGVQAFAIVGFYESTKYLPYCAEETDEDSVCPICIIDNSSQYNCQACLQKKKLIKQYNKECYKNCYLNNRSMNCIQNVTSQQVIDAISMYYKEREQ